MGGRLSDEKAGPWQQKCYILRSGSSIKTRSSPILSLNSFPSFSSFSSFHCAQHTRPLSTLESASSTMYCHQSRNLSLDPFTLTEYGIMTRDASPSPWIDHSAFEDVVQPIKTASWLLPPSAGNSRASSPVCNADFDTFYESHDPVNDTCNAARPTSSSPDPLCTPDLLDEDRGQVKMVIYIDSTADEPPQRSARVSASVPSACPSSELRHRKSYANQRSVTAAKSPNRSNATLTSVIIMRKYRAG